MSSSTDPFTGLESKRKDSDMENGKSIDIKNAVSLTDEEMEQFTGGRSKISSMSALPPAPPICFCSRKKDPALLPAARCKPHTECAYYKDCKHPDRIKK